MECGCRETGESPVSRSSSLIPWINSFDSEWVVKDFVMVVDTCQISDGGSVRKWRLGDLVPLKRRSFHFSSFSTGIWDLFLEGSMETNGGFDRISFTCWNGQKDNV